MNYLAKRLNLFGVGFLAGLLFLFFSQSSFAQLNDADSLQNIIPSLTGKARVDALIEYSRAIKGIDYGKSKATAQEAYKLADKINYDRGKVLALISEGVNEFSIFNNTQSRKLFNESIHLSRKIGTRDLEGYAYAYLGLNYQNANQLDSALIYYNDSMLLLKDANNPFYLSFLYLTLSDYYGVLGESENQFNYLAKCWAIREKFKFTKYLPYIGTRMAAYYVNKGDFGQAKSYLDKAQNALGNDTLKGESIALIHQQRAILYAREGKVLLALDQSSKAKKFYEENSFPLELTNLLIETGEVFEDISNYEAGLKDLLRALEIAEANQFEFEIVKIWIRSAWIYYDLNELEMAKENLNKAMSAPTISRYPKEEAAALSLMGLILTAEKKMDESMLYLKRSLAIRKRINYKIGVAASYFNIGLAFEDLNNLDSALYYHKKSLALEEANGHLAGIAY